MKSNKDLIEQDISNRLQNLQGERDMLGALHEQERDLLALDNIAKLEENRLRDELNSIYLELRHFTGKWPKVYSSSDVEKWPLVMGVSDDDCNPYFPISHTKQKIGRGISPLYISPASGYGKWSRDRVHPGMSEPDIRSQATGLLLSLNKIIAAENAEHKFNLWQLKQSLTAWKTKISRDLLPELHNSDLLDLKSFWLELETKIAVVLEAIPGDISDVNSLNKFKSKDVQDAIAYISSDIESNISNRIKYLQSISEKYEKEFFDIVKLRLTQSNGTLDRLNSIRFQIQTSRVLIEDHLNSIRTLNILKSSKL